MTKTLLQVLNNSLKRARVITEDLTSFTDSQYQPNIDTMLQVIQEVVRDALSRAPNLVQEGAVSTITLVADQREYSLPSDLEQINWPLQNESSGFYISEFNGGFNKMRRTQPQPSQYTGRPQSAAINPSNGKLRMDRSPQSGDLVTYKLYFDKRIVLDNKTDIFPFSDSAVDSLVPAFREKYNFDFNNTGSLTEYRKALAAAIRFMTKLQAK